MTEPLFKMVPDELYQYFTEALTIDWHFQSVFVHSLSKYNPLIIPFNVLIED